VWRKFLDSEGDWDSEYYAKDRIVNVLRIDSPDCFVLRGTVLHGMA